MSASWVVGPGVFAFDPLKQQAKLIISALDTYNIGKTVVLATIGTELFLSGDATAQSYIHAARSSLTLVSRSSSSKLSGIGVVVIKRSIIGTVTLTTAAMISVQAGGWTGRQPAT